MYSVLFDKEFPSGMTFGGSTKRGYKVCRMSFINLSHAIRINKYKPLSLKNKKETNHTSNSEKQVCIFSFEVVTFFLVTDVL